MRTPSFPCCSNPFTFLHSGLSSLIQTSSLHPNNLNSLQTSPKMMKLKLFIDKDTNKVLYAEAGKDFVDFLLHTFMMPLGYAMKNVFDGAVTGGLATLYTSASEDLSTDYFVAGSKTKASFTNPNVIKTLYLCPSCRNSVSDVKGLRCHKCLYSLNPIDVYVAPSTAYKIEIGAGHVKEMMTYMITDDLAIKPLSSSTVTMNHLSQLCIKDFSCIQETEVTVDTNQGMELVKASLHSKTVLTDTFLPLKKEKSNEL